VKIPLLRWNLRRFRHLTWPILAGAALTAVVLTVALLLGDTLRAWHLRLESCRLGTIQSVLSGGDRFFRAALADQFSPARVAPILQVDGSLESPDHAAYPVNTRILGVDARFWKFSPAGQPPVGFTGQGVYINATLADRLNVDIGDEILIRASADSFGTSELQLRFAAPVPRILRRKVSGLLNPDLFSRFNLHQDERAQPLLILGLGELQSLLQQPGKANLLISDSPATEPLNTAFRSAFTLEDTGSQSSPVLEQDEWEINSRRIFLDAPIGRAATRAGLNAEGILTYFVTGLATASNVTPYSMVTALPASRLPVDLADDQILIHPWLAQDLALTPGDTLTLHYFIPSSNRRLIETQAVFKVHSILADSSPLLDSTLVPDFPGLQEVNQCSDWKPDFPIDLNRIRPRDEAYWKSFRAIPKAFITLAAGQALWSNPYGDLTAIRFHISAANSAEELDAAIAQHLDPRDLGLIWSPVHPSSPETVQDFGSLFLGLSIFLALAALALTSLAWNLELSRRIPEIGLLRAIGFPPGRITRLFQLEILIGIALGAFIGLILGSGLVAGFLQHLEGLFEKIPDGPLPSLVFPGTLPFKVIGGTLIAALFCTFFRIRSLCRQPITHLLQGRLSTPKDFSRSRQRVLLFSLLALFVVCGAGVTAFKAFSASPEQLPILALGAGTAGLLGGLLATAAGLARPIDSAHPGLPGLLRLGLRDAARNPDRSLTVIGIAATGVFLVIAVNVFHRNPFHQADRRDSGTGGFTLYAEASAAQHRLLHDVRDHRWDPLGPALSPASVMPLRLRPGDDASCRSALRSHRPPLLGVPSESLQKRGAFHLLRVLPGLDPSQGWRLLQHPLPDGALPVFGDVTTLAWGLHQSLGALVESTTDQGEIIHLRIIGELGDSILQGVLIMDESLLLQAFPSDPGPRRFLIDSPPTYAAEAVHLLNREYSAEGLLAERAVDRLQSLYAVEARYLAIFQLLGSVGLVFGAVALGLILLQQARERRQEIGLLRAVGWRPSTIARLLAAEQFWLLSTGVGLGTLAGCLTALPWLLRQGGHLPWLMLIACLVGMLVVGLAGLGLTARRAVHHSVCELIREE
jgi:putative ABC transport system permease protein